MQQIILIIHILLALSLIGLILIQQGKGAEAGASFGGGASQTVFGSQGSTSFLFKLTAGMAILFLVTSMVLTRIAANKYHSGNTDSIVPATNVAVPVTDKTSTKTIKKTADKAGIPAKQTQKD